MNMRFWNEAYLDTPLARGAEGVDQDKAFRTPGSYVKSRELDTDGSFPKLFGILVAYEPSALGILVTDGSGDYCKHQVLVRSQGSPVSLAGTVWCGTVAEYEAMWRVD